MLKQYGGEKTALDLAHAIGRHGEGLVAQAKVPLGAPLETVRAILLLRMISGVDAICMLTAFGFITEAKTVHRSLVDALIRLRGLCKQPDLLYEYLAQESTDNTRLLEDFKQFQGKWGEPKESPTDAEVEAELNKAVAHRRTLEVEAGRELKKMNEWKWAIAGEIQEIFWAHYALRSQSVHHSPRDLNRHLVENEKGEVYGILYGPERERPTQLILDATKALTLGMDAFADAAGVAISEELADLDRSLADIYAAVAGSSDRSETDA